MVPAGVPLRGPGKSCDKRLCAASEEAAGSDEPDSIAVGLSVLLCNRAARPAASAAYAGLFGSWQLWAACPSAGVGAHNLLS